MSNTTIQKIQEGIWKFGETVYMMSDNYGYHSCEATMYKMSWDDYERSSRVDPREEIWVVGDELEFILAQDYNFRNEWNEHCNKCYRISSSYISWYQ